MAKAYCTGCFTGNVLRLPINLRKPQNFSTLKDLQYVISFCLVRMYFKLIYVCMYVCMYVCVYVVHTLATSTYVRTYVRKYTCSYGRIS